LTKVFRSNPRRILWPDIAFESLRAALKSETTLRYCFVGECFDPNAIEEVCHDFMALRPNPNDWPKVVAEPVSRCMARLMNEAMRTKFQAE